MIIKRRIHSMPSIWAAMSMRENADIRSISRVQSPFGLSGFRTFPTPFETNRSGVSEDIEGQHRQGDQEHRDPASVGCDDRSEHEDRNRRKAPILLPELRRDDPEGGQAVHQDREFKS